MPTTNKLHFNNFLTIPRAGQRPAFCLYIELTDLYWYICFERTYTYMKSTKTHVRFIPFRTAFIKQFVPFVLLIGFLNTALFPSVFVLHKRAKSHAETLCDAQVNTSLTEYILEDCLQIYDPTLDGQEEDVDNLEKLYDEIDLLHSVVPHVYLQSDTDAIKARTCYCCLLICSCYNSSTPPPEQYFV